MNYIDAFIIEHQQITKLVDETKELLPHLEDKNNQLLLLAQLRKLTDTLISHLISEENIVYPEFLKSPDIVVRAKADGFITDLQELKEKFNEFKEAFQSLEQITNNLEYTRLSIEKTLQEIETRVHKEDNDLFLAAKKL